MGDYTWHTLHVYGTLDMPVTVDDEPLPATIADLIEEGLSDFATEWDTSQHFLEAAGEASMGTVDEIQAWLETFKTEHPTAIIAYEVNCDPKYEYMGAIVYSAPGLPQFDGECDGDGNVFVRHDQITNAINTVAAPRINSRGDEIVSVLINVNDVHAAIDKLFGGDVYAAVASYRCKACMAGEASTHAYERATDGDL
jgi:hypothetical protein